MPCPSCTLSRLLFAAFVVAVLAAGCRGGSPEPVDPLGSYEAFGAAITPDDALPALVVASEADQWVGQPVKVEGVVAEVCQSAGCWLTLQVGPDHAPIRVEVPRDDAGAYAYTFPMDISGRRVVIAGTLQSGDDAAHQHTGSSDEAEHAESEAHNEAEARAMTLDLAIVADGALLERDAPDPESPSNAI